ncbi:unnamed protein product [Staurois parvus]|uniref:Uncharacterized protein n=1 Tax=Staurois parvus TaxID=386267 RepID=A0ABN9F5M6_9NEOB|nr:unnamed protein product [Staurois parvus]
MGRFPCSSLCLPLPQWGDFHSIFRDHRPLPNQWGDLCSSIGCLCPSHRWEISHIFECLNLPQMGTFPRSICVSKVPCQ